MNKQRKHMSVDEETFFTTVSLMYGAPDRRAKNYRITVSNGFVVGGVDVYLREDPRGRVFTQCVTSFGEAKCRAGKWYRRYTQWWRKQYDNDSGRSPSGT